MALRLNPKQDERTRSAIRTSQLVNRLEAYALGEIEPKSKKPVEMSKGQITAAIALIRKTLPDLTSTELSSDADNPVRFVVYGEREAASAVAWQEQHNPKSE